MANLTLSLAVMTLMVFVLDVNALSNSEICALPSRTGRHRAYFERWYYNHVEGICKTFVFGGGNDGNQNNFKTEAKCLAFCNKATVCQKFPAPTGPTCMAYIPRYTYDPDTQRCKRFIYGGCGGNANNFGTKSACEAKCT